MALFGRRKKVRSKKVKPKLTRSEILEKRPALNSLLILADKKGKHNEVMKAIQSGKLKVGKDIRKYGFDKLVFHGALGKNVSKKISREGIKAKTPKEWQKNPNAIYFQGNLPKELMYKGKSPFSSEFNERHSHKKERGYGPEAGKEAVEYVSDPKGKLRRMNKFKIKGESEIERVGKFEASVVAVDAEKLTKKGIKFIPDPEYAGSYVAVDAKTGKLIKNIPSESFEFKIDSDRGKITKKVDKHVDENIGKRLEKWGDDEIIKDRKSLEKYERKSIAREKDHVLTKQELMKKMDEKYIKKIIEQEREEPLKRKKKKS